MCEKRDDRRCCISTVMVGRRPASTEHVGLAIAMLRCVLKDEQ